MKKFDAIIIGSGQAGTPLAFKLAAEGNKVAFIEKKHFGGTCVNDGCTPTKAYVASARRIWDACNGAALGVNIPEGASADLKKIKSRKDKIVQESVDGISSGVEKEENITFFEGEARFSGEKTIEVNSEEITASEIYINTGARPVIPEPFRKLNYLTNESILQLEELPEHLVIVGGSYIGLEFGQMFRRFGSKVTIIEKGPSIIGREDKEISENIQEFLQDEGIEFRLNAKCIGGTQNADNSVTLKLDCKEGGPEVTGSHLLIGVGRKPNTDSLNLQAAGIKIGDRGYIKVNDFLETNVKGVFALGDCNGEGAFTHTSYNDYEIIVANKFSNINRRISDRVMTYNLYTDPPLGRAGMTRKAALAKGYKIMEATMPMSRVARAREKGETNGMMQVIVNAENQKILGASILGVGGDEIINSILLIMYADVPYTVLKNAVISHPTVSELLPTLLKGLKEI
ncbi:FAD-containing oxidoreductase [Prolixibacter sp. SD074]|uniref:FAD-containing oxidoreductase n=1 Tax=Prolixibacter sp. SD074 TaxID=2652391 RepID=UPI00128142FB|nr:FAD-containing oxidoreductase [Prolixibacter sp. SD074]GET28803.1 mercuric reductase [Prolixibacter sp. SD074]